MPAIAKAEQRTQEADGQLGGTLEGSLGAIRTIKASRAEQRIGDSVVEDARTAARHAVESVWRQALAWTVSWGGVNLAIIAVLALGAWRVSSGQLAVSSLIAFLLYAFQLMGPVSQLAQNVTALQSGIAAAARIQEVGRAAATGRGHLAGRQPDGGRDPQRHRREVNQGRRCHCGAPAFHRHRGRPHRRAGRRGGARPGHPRRASRAGRALPGAGRGPSNRCAAENPCACNGLSRVSHAWPPRRRGC